jgi:hypothetical protein
MSGKAAYPSDLARYVEANWPTETPLWLSSSLLNEALAIAFEASLTAEETRPTRFRMLLTPVGRLPADGVFGLGALRLRFDRTRPLHEGELRRLAPAAAFETALIGVHEEQGALRIWGIAHSGPAWLAPTWGGRRVVPIWTTDPIIHVTGPGQLAVRCAGKLVGALERSELVDTFLDVFESEWLRDMFTREREHMLALHDERQSRNESPTAVEPSLVGRIGQHMLRRMIQLVRSARHGGMILVVDSDLAGLRLKYRFESDEPTQRYRALVLKLLEAIASSSPKQSVGWADFATAKNIVLEKLEQALFEWSRVVANLASIDGAVVMDKQFALRGFGAEVSSELPPPACVWRALDNEAHARREDDFENVGTRHRAAYRFVNQHPEGLAIVISHDGVISFVANRNGDVVIWEQSLSP